MVSLAGGYRSVGGIAKDDGVDLGWIIFLVGRRGRSGGGGTGSAGAVGGYMCMSGVTHGIENRGECSGGSYDSEQDGSGANRLTARDIEARSSERGDAGGEGLLHGWVVLECSGAVGIGGGPAGLAATGSVDGLSKEA
jgi:hypothetical protein